MLLSKRVSKTVFHAKKLEKILLENTREKLLAMAMAARSLAKPDATRIVAQTCIEISEVQQ